MLRRDEGAAWWTAKDGTRFGKGALSWTVERGERGGEEWRLGGWDVARGSEDGEKRRFGGGDSSGFVWLVLALLVQR